ncbi:uncharacterized protein LOC132278419 [Cornus florida]|uniref:uncharacterized protein LOC132278419 n=1 Tax=Cornus florida TaxID=4283 RepID=UPI00289CA94F|nr:uncharacterized protein LOC132278419 [Cornus florida]
MKIKLLVLGLWTLLELFGLSYTASFDDFAFSDDSSVVYTYNRFAEIEKQCSPFLSSASELKPDDSRSYRLKNELSFFNGDWEQEAGGAPLMPFDDSDMPADSSSFVSPLKLVSFEVKDVNSVHQSKKVVSLSGVLSIGISRNSTYAPELFSSFYYMRPGLSALKIVFEGVYIETEENGGEHLLCLLGISTLPYYDLVDVFQDMTDNFGSHYKRWPQLKQDDQIFLILHYPRTFSLTTRAIRGEMRSLNKRESFQYFDKVHISSQLGRYSKYQFITEKLKSRTCDPRPIQYELLEDGVNMLNASEFCKVLKYFSNEAYSIAPNWKFSGRYERHIRLGPFLLGKEIKSVDWTNVKLMMQNIICEEETTDYKTGNARVSAVFRAFALMERHVVAMRRGLSGLTLSVEGIWNSSMGQLCMVGCIGAVDSGLEGCDSQISLYFPRSLSSRQRSIIYGSISSIENETNSYFPILFGLEMSPSNIRNNHEWYSSSYLSYSYAKTELAGAFRERSQPSKFIAIIRQYLLTYPALEDKEDSLASLNLLSNDLHLAAYVAPRYINFFVLAEVLSLGPLVGRYTPRSYKDGSPVNAQVELTSSDRLNVSLHLKFGEDNKPYKSEARMFLEGLYDPLVGEMYLIACAKAMAESINIESGLDCSTEVKIEYPSESLRWLINPTAKITITNQRSEYDPLYFLPIRARTSVIRYGNHESDVLFRKVFEGILRIVMLLVSVGIIISQLLYMKRKTVAIPYISLVMLGIQFLGYSLPLISSAEILFKSKESESYRNHPYDYQRYQMLFKALDYTAKLLVLAALLLTARAFQLVSASRNQLHSHGTSEPVAVPSDKRVLLITIAVHIFWFFLPYGLLLLFGKDTNTVSVDMLQNWLMGFGAYFGLVQDFFMLPQIIGNFLWKPRVQALQKYYFSGFVLVSLLLSFYDNLRDPVVDPYSESVPF